MNRVIIVQLNLLLVDLSSFLDLCLHGLIQFQMGIEVVLWITVRLLNAALLKYINIIQSFDALNIAHFPILLNSAHNDLLITLIVHAVASAEPSRRRCSSDMARSSSLGIFLGVKSSIRSLDKIVLARGKYTACGLASAAVSVARLDICGSP